MTRAELIARYRELVLGELPRRARAERVAVEGDPLLRALDAQSLAWRGKPPKSAR